MPPPRDQRVSDLLHELAELVQEADAYLVEGDLFKSMVKPPAKSKGQMPGQREPHKADRVTNRLRKLDDNIGNSRDMLRARRERKQRSRYQKKKLVQGDPLKSFGSRLRDR